MACAEAVLLRSDVLSTSLLPVASWPYDIYNYRWFVLLFFLQLREKWSISYIFVNNEKNEKLRLPTVQSMEKRTDKVIWTKRESLMELFFNLIKWMMLQWNASKHVGTDGSIALPLLLIWTLPGPGAAGFAFLSWCRTTVLALCSWDF